MNKDPNWIPLLQELSELMLRVNDDNSFSERNRSELADLPLNWTEYQPASELELAELELRLDAKLPPSYRSFLKVTNGFGPVGYNIDSMLPATEVGWCRDLDNPMVKGWIEGEADSPSPPIPDNVYFIYGDAQDSCDLRPEYLWGCLQISDIGDGEVILLNPAIQTENGEWEAWLFGAAFPGARRYPSFYNLMQQRLETARYLLSDQDAPEQPLPRPNGGKNPGEPTG